MNWISAKDKLPQSYTDVLGYFPDGTEEGRIVAMAHSNGKKIQSSANTSTAHCFIATHWMPLPEPPQADQPKSCEECEHNDKDWDCLNCTNYSHYQARK